MLPRPAKLLPLLLRLACLGMVTAGWMAEPARAQPLVPAQGILRLESRTLQFLVFGAPPGTAQGPPSLSLIQSNHLQMEPTVLVLTCERVKTELIQELGLIDQWKGRIQINVRGELRPTEPVVVESQWYPGGWSFQLVLPGQLERTRLMRALTRALLLEIANRNNRTQRLAEIPLWLEEGLATHLLALHGDSLVPEIRTLSSTVQNAQADAFAEARRRLRGAEQVPFAELCSAQPDQFNDEQWEVFRRTAQLLVAELMNLPDGRACLQEFLVQLPAYRNSQFAFLRGFEPHLPTMLAAEKWWSVAWMNFTGRDRHMRFTVEHSLRQLEDILTAPISVRIGTNSVPGRKNLPLREVIANTDYAQHQPAVAQAGLQLQILQAAAPVEMARLVADYRQALLAYLKRRATYSTTSTSMSADAKLATKEVLERLDLLEVIRADFGRIDVSSAAEPAGP